MIDAEAQLLICNPDTPDDGAAQAYTSYLHDLLSGEISYAPVAVKEDAVHLKQTVAGNGRVLSAEPAQFRLKQPITQSPTSLLWAKRPCWPIKHILLILRFEETDDAAAEWLVRLAQPSGAAVTILPLVPSLPAMHRLGNHVQTGLDVLLSPNTPAGQSLRRLTQRLTAWQISGDLHLRQSEPEWQIREEVAEGNYDLLVIGAEPHGRLHHLLSDELVGPLLHWVERPLLIAQSPQFIAEEVYEQPAPL